MWASPEPFFIPHFDFVPFIYTCAKFIKMFHEWDPWTSQHLLSLVGLFSLSPSKHTGAHSPGSLIWSKWAINIAGLAVSVAAESQRLRWIIDETILKWQFFVYLAMCFVAISVLVSLNWYIRYKIARRSEITGTDVDHYRITFSCVLSFRWCFRQRNNYSSSPQIERIP